MAFETPVMVTPTDAGPLILLMPDPAAGSIASGSEFPAAGGDVRHRSAAAWWGRRIMRDLFGPSTFASVFKWDGTERNVASECSTMGANCDGGTTGGGWCLNITSRKFMPTPTDTP